MRNKRLRVRNPLKGLRNPVKSLRGRNPLKLLRGRNPLKLLRGAYGANPLHLLALVACFALTGYVASFLVGYPLLLRIVIWFLAAVIAHDLVLFPLYALADLSLRGVLWLLPRPGRTPAVPPLNYIRVPALGAGLTFLLFLPGIIQQGAATYLAATGLTQQPFLARWLLLTAAMFGVSAILYAVRARRARPRPAPKKKAPEPPKEAVVDTSAAPGAVPEA